jgi:hypothetical protein
MRPRLLWPPLAIVLLGLGFSVLPLLQGKFFFAMDNGAQNYPQTVFLNNALHHHVLPQWWFDVGFGAPVVAEGQAGHYYPPRVLLSALFDAPTAYMLEFGLYLALSGLGTYLFLRELRLHRLAAAAGAIGFMFGGPCIIYVRSMALLRASCLLPWIMWSVERYALRRRSTDLLWAALVFGLQFLSGNPTYAVITTFGSPTYLLLRNWQTPSMRPPRKLALSLAGWALAAVLGLGIAAAQIIPTVMHLHESTRAGGLSIEYTANSLRAHYKDLFQFLFPYPYDLGDLTSNGLFNPAAISGFYVGSLIAMAALCLPAWIRRNTDRAVPLFVCCLIATTIALGSSTPAFALLSKLPLMGSFRFPARYLLWASFCAASLGAIAIHRVMALSRIRSRNTGLRPLALVSAAIIPIAAIFCVLRPDKLADVAVCLVLLALSAGLLALLFHARGAGQRSAALALLCIFLTADLLHFRSHWHYASTSDIARTLRKDGVAGWLAKDPAHFRIFAIRSHDDGRIDLKNDLLQSAPPNWGLQSIGYSFSLGLKEYAQFVGELQSRIRMEPASIRKFSRLLDFMRVKYIVTSPDLLLPGWQMSLRTPDVIVWRNPEFRDSGFLIGHVEPENQVHDPGTVDFRRTALIAGDRLPLVGNSEHPGEVIQLPQQVDEMDFRVAAASNALLAVPNNYYPGWSATVNGKAAPIYRTDWIGMGVAVAAGNSLVRLHFVTPGSQMGLWISAASILFWLASFLAAHRLKNAGI